MKAIPSSKQIPLVIKKKIKTTDSIKHRRGEGEQHDARGNRLKKVKKETFFIP